jgi:hypothetical protein
MPSSITKISVLFCFTVLSLTSFAEISDANWQKLKQQALDRKREIIYNTDGCDVVYFPRNLPATKENFIKQRLIHALGSKIDTISYCPLSSGFGYLTSNTKAGDKLLVSPQWNNKVRNIAGELFKLGTDPLKITEEFCRKNKFEFFISLRCNDTHDMAHRPNKPHPFFPPFKTEHPEYLMATYSKRPPHCNWSAVDFSHKAVRNRWVAIAEELMTNYDLDGLELDFCRHMQYFKSVAWGSKASQKECAMMTECMRKIRASAERIGRKRGRPILISARLPDSVDYAKAVGLDVEEWMKEKLIDIYIGGFYFQLNPWEKSVDTCKKYGVKFYPSLDESRISKVSWSFYRTSPVTYYAREAAALQAGADGIYYFNLEGQKNLHKIMRGNLDDIRLEDKRYFISYLHYSPDTYLKNGHKYSSLKNISQYSPVLVKPGQPLKFILEIGDDFNHPDVKKETPTMTAYVDAADNNGKNLIIKVNGHKLNKIKSYGIRSKWLTRFNASLNYFKPGVNEIILEALPVSGSSQQELLIMSGQKLLKGRNQAPWRRLFNVHDFKNSEKIVNGAYRICDSGSNDDEFANLLYPIAGIPGKHLQIKFQAKVENASTALSNVCRIADGKYVEIITLQPDKIGLHYINKSVKFNTTDRFHEYDAVMKDDRFILKVDGKELFNEKLVMSADSPGGRLRGNAYTISNMNNQSLLFGSLSGRGTGSALWKNICILGDNSGIFVKDLQFELKFPKIGKLRKYAKIVPEWDLQFDVKNGKIPDSKNIKNTYKESNIAVVKGENNANVLLLKHFEGYETISIDELPVNLAEKGILLAEWKIKYTPNRNGKSSFQIVFKPLTPEKKTLICNLQFFADAILAPWGIVNLPQNIEKHWVTFRIAIDVKTKVAVLWLDGKQIGGGSISVRSRIAPGTFFGDGSGAIEGQSELEYIKMKTFN